MRFLIDLFFGVINNLMISDSTKLTMIQKDINSLKNR